MALLHNASIVPTKLDMLRQWVPLQDWATHVDAHALDIIDAYRFDDPDGEVGIESFLLRTADGRVLHVPLTYRGQPLTGAEAALVTTMDHTVLGTRWVYDGCADPVYLRTLVDTILSGSSEAALEFDGPTPEGREVVRTRVRGSGVPDGRVPVADFVTTTVVREVDAEFDSSSVGAGTFTLTGTWPGQTEPALLATVLAN
ncbi:MAG: hypothetical protein WBF79_04230 [Rhodococcus sp. (in: high G+C Gram-positive bacteria)]